MPNQRGDDWGRTVVVASVDLVCWPIAVLFTALVDHAELVNDDLALFSLLCVVAQLAVGWAIGIYRRRFVPFSFEEVGCTALTVGIAGVLGTLAYALVGPEPFGAHAVWVIASAAALILGMRFARRARARWIRGRTIRHRSPVVVMGAGEGGQRAVRAMLQATDGPNRPVALLDDDPGKRNLRLFGVRVEGTFGELAAVAARHHARTVLLALPSAGPELLSRLHRQADAAGLTTLVMPPVQQLVGTGSTAELRTWSDEDVLRRTMVTIDMDQVRGMIAGKRVLVTGAGGSIGSELSRQIAGCSPQLLALVDHDDSLLHAIKRDLDGDQAVFPVLADIRDADRLDEVFATYQPELVFHAAALKHVPALEGAPSEGWKTNVLGTRNVLVAAERHGVERFVNISTDKAADPVNVLGRTKRVGEMLTASVAERTGRRFVSVRFGNVIGSRGSVMETFQTQIDAGGPVTVTHPDVTRFFMAVREAVRLTLQAATVGAPGEVLVLDMGAPVRIADVARQLIEQSGRPIAIRYTGLRPGEKLHEVLLSDGEEGSRPHHPLIDHVAVTPAWPDLPSRFDPDLFDALVPVEPPLYAGRTLVEGEEART